jgi:Response regulator containing a CheY-like receiver domain and an HD-GYP domain
MDAPDQVNVLLVDDQPSKLMSYEVILGSLGARLIKANSAREALEILLRTEVAVILTDVCMPELDGFEFAAMLREHPRYQQTAIIFISAVHLSDADRARGYEIGAVDYVPVPVVPEILRAKVKVFVELYRKSRQLAQLNNELEQRVNERTSELQVINDQLRASEERLRLASEAAEFGTYDFNTTDNTIHCSAHLKRLLNTQIPGEMPFSTFLSLIHSEDREAVRKAMVVEDEQSNTHEVEFRTAEMGRLRWLLDRGRTFELGDADKRVLRVMGTMIDITPLRLAAERQRLLTPSWIIG